jgi:excisionase family DNA binding protein
MAREEATDDLCPKQAANILRVSRRTVYRWCKTGLLGTKEPDGWRISREELAMFRRGSTGSAGAVARFMGRESDKLSAALRALFFYTRIVHEKAIQAGDEGPGVDWSIADEAHDDAAEKLRAVGVPE